MLYLTLQKTGFHFCYLVVAYFRQSERGDRAKKSKQETPAMSWGAGGGGTPHMKGVGMLVVSLRGVNFGFWSRLGCSGQNAIIFSREGLV